ncbi:DUF4148 domain-containing protein [Noviherbaspirillum sp. ST9]|uniref:DUF4148 domain-containing protein n=1 Tax=Noviherbaspirillum sp. ST9 TaxID=3401606 RepID=UPI003B58A3B7
MNAKLSSIAIALIATTASAFAADPVLTRAQVRAEVEQAYARGELNRQNEFVEYTNVPATAPRAQVRVELDRAYTQGQSVTQQAEFVEHNAPTGGKSRAEARAELEQAYVHGQVGNQSEFVEHTNIATSKARDEAIRAAKSVRAGTSSGS